MSAAGEGLTEPHYNLRIFPCADADKSGRYFLFTESPICAIINLKGGVQMFDSLKKTSIKINTTEIIDEIENSVYLKLKPLGFRKHGRTLHRFVDGDISQVINFQCGQAYRDETHLMAVNIGIRVPECFLREFRTDEPQKKYYHEYECNIRSRLGFIKGTKESCYDLRKDTQKITDDILNQINRCVLPAFEVLNSRDAILKERRNYPNFDVINGHFILLDEAMIYGKMGDFETATACFKRYYIQCWKQKRPKPHIKYLEEIATKLEIPLGN